MLTKKEQDINTAIGIKEKQILGARNRAIILDVQVTALKHSLIRKILTRLQIQKRYKSNIVKVGKVEQRTLGLEKNYLSNKAFEELINRENQR